MKLRHWGIGEKFIFFISLSVLSFMVATLLITRNLLQDYALTSSGELATTILDQTDARLAQFFHEMESVARGLAGTRAVREIDPSGMRDLFISTVTARKRYLRAIFLGTTDGRMFEWGDGKGFVGFKPTFPPGYDPRIRPWYRMAMGREGFSVSPPYRFASVDEMGITCVLPILKKEGGLKGVLGLDILLADFRNLLEDLELPKGGRALVLDLEGSVVASQFPEDLYVRSALVEFGIAAKDNPAGASPGAYVGKVAGKDMRFVYKRAKSLEWIIGVAMPLDLIVEPARALLSLVTALDLLLILLFFIFLVGITGRLVVSPLNHIVRVVNRIEGGERGVRADWSSHDEFGLLAEELNKLVAASEEHSRDLEDKVARRTEEILRLQRENTQLKLFEERQRIYRDMHDSIGAKLTNVFFCNGVARELAKEGPADLREMQDRIEANCLEAIQDLKEIILGMREGTGASAGFARKLREGIGQRLGSRNIVFDCRVRNRGEFDSLGQRPRGELEMIFDELVSNVLKHSQATSVTLRMKAEDGEAAILFQDNGVGFDPEVADRSVSGLRNIRYRIEKLGGSLSIASGAGKGAGFSFSLPLGGGGD